MNTFGLKICSIFRVQAGRKNSGKIFAKSFEEDLELHNLLDLDAEDVDNEEVDGVEGEISII